MGDMGPEQSHHDETCHVPQAGHVTTDDSYLYERCTCKHLLSAPVLTLEVN